ncbi:MAG TPA: SDR family NAD(P)-dependent oxidoreductase [Gemmatimonadaceae bacterium]|nr:SDR family NAD(P)-dependent oxidoreductase [Gemmatimonadaceae bacterium]
MPTALITGATRGLGHALAFDFARDGYTVYGTGRSEEGLAALGKEARDANRDVRPLRADVATEQGAEAILQRLDADSTRLDVVVHNAGALGDRVELAKYPLETWDEVVATNVRGPFLLTQRLLPKLASNAAVIFVSSGIVEKARPRWGAYYVSKVAVDAVAATYAVELKSHGIRVFVVNPGPLRTEMRADAFPSEDPASVPAPEERTGVFLWLARKAGLELTGTRYEAEEFSARRR